ncbi:oligopeptide ABC transporter permease [Litoribacterium kuwaitense]|uniref:oligopeptide ABC transporter permease n=1 Tax=Litoribacterium kuwaitense TaxID=1398745 RepID=UPI001FED2590|nr:oligopeptide ABC transporter permease [Litoribacterium kuwaitense]
MNQQTTIVNPNPKKYDIDQKGLSPWAVARGKFIRNIPAMTGLIFLIVLTLLCVIWPMFSAQDLERINYTQMDQPPSLAHWLGTDANGRDVFASTLKAGQTSLLIGYMCMFFIVLIGTCIGSISGFFGGRVDAILMRFTDFVMIFPFLVFVIVLNSILVGMGFNSGPWVLIIVLSVLSWGGVARLVRGKVLAEKENEYVASAVSIGSRPATIIRKHLLPNVASVIIVQATLLLATTIVAESGLSFIGFGVPSDVPTWGNMMSAARESEVLREKWWVWVPPAFCVVATLISINFVGEGLKDALNPKSTR